MAERSAPAQKVIGDILQDAISGHRFGSIDPELVEDLSSRLVEALLAPVLAALDSAHGSHRGVNSPKQSSSSSICERDGLDVKATQCIEDLEGR